MSSIITPAASSNLVQAKQKTVDEPKTSDIVFADDADLAGFVLSSGKLYVIEAHIIVISASVTPDFKFKLNGAASNATFGSYSNIAGAAILGGQLNGANQSIVQLTAGVGHYIRLMHAWEPTADGNLALQWAQNVSDASAVTVSESSWMKLTEVG